MSEGFYVILGAFLSAFTLWVFERRKRARHAKYLATRVVGILDGFVEGAADVSLDDGIENNEGHVVQNRHELPAPISFPNDLDWGVIDAKLMYEIVILPSDIERANSFIEFTFSANSTPPDYAEGYEERKIRYAVFGIRAANLSDQLRAKYKLPDRDISNWDPVNAMTEVKLRIEGLRARGVGMAPPIPT